MDYLRATLGICRVNYPDFFGKIKDFPYQFTKSKRGMKVLEVGCGWGRATIGPAKEGAESFGVDISASSISLAKRYAQNKKCYVNLVVACAELLPFKEETFEAVHSWFVLQHMSKHNAIRAINEVRRVLKKGGKFHVQLPNKFGTDELVDGFVYLFKRYMLKRDLSPINAVSFVKFCTLPEIRILFKEFHSIRVRGLEYRPPKYLFPFIPRKVLGPIRKLSDFFEKLSNSQLPILKNILCTDFIVIAKK